MEQHVLPRDSLKVLRLKLKQSSISFTASCLVRSDQLLRCFLTLSICLCHLRLAKRAMFLNQYIFLVLHFVHCQLSCAHRPAEQASFFLHCILTLSICFCHLRLAKRAMFLNYIFQSSISFTASCLVHTDQLSKPAFCIVSRH